MSKSASGGAASSAPVSSATSSLPASTVAPAEGPAVVIAYSDGACDPNPGPGGWGAVLRYKAKKKELSGALLQTTNNQMELLGAIKALEELKRPCHVTLHTDSQYVQKGITEWIKGWKKNGWITKTKEPVKNAAMWQQLDALCAKHQVTWKWVKGHAGIPDNERCDELAVAAMCELTGRPPRQPGPRSFHPRGPSRGGVARRKPPGGGRDR